MKRIILCAISVLLLTLTFTHTISAEAYFDESLPRVYDEANLLSDSEEEELGTRIQNIIDTYKIDVVIFTVNSLTDYDYDEDSIMSFTDDMYDYNGYGVGENRDGIAFSVDMDSRAYWLSTTGYAETAFTDYGIEHINGEVESYLADGDYFGAFTTLLDNAEIFVNEAENGEAPYDSDHPYVTSGDYIVAEGIVILASVIIALIVVFVLKGKLKTVFPKTQANDYVRAGSFEVESAKDVFMYQNTTRVAIQSSSSSGGSSTHIGSSGTSHGGGGGHF